MAELSGYDFESGALGAVVAETVGELINEATKPDAEKPSPALLEEAYEAAKKKEAELGRKLTSQEYQEVTTKVAQSRDQARQDGVVFAGKAAAIVGAFVAGLDVEGADKVACNALENNLAPTMMVEAQATAAQIQAALLGSVGGATLWSIEGLLADLEKFGRDIKKSAETAFTLYSFLLSNPDFKLEFFTWRAQEYGTNQCARPEDNVEAKPFITPVPEQQRPLGCEGIPLKPASKEDYIICGGIPIKQSTLDDLAICGGIDRPEVKLSDLILTMGEAEFKAKFGVGDEVDLRGIKSRFPEAEDNRAKIWGKEQVTGGANPDYGHGEESLRIAEELAKNPDVKVIMLNRRINRYLDKDKKLLPGNTRPDVSYLTKDGKVHQIEVQSKTDKEALLLARMDNTNSKLPVDMQGTVDVIVREFK